MTPSTPFLRAAVKGIASGRRPSIFITKAQHKEATMVYVPGRRFSNNDKIFTAWIPRQGDNVIIRADRVASTFGGTCLVTVYVRTKNTEETGDGQRIEAPGGSAYALTVASSDTTVKELVIPAAAPATPPEGIKEAIRLEIVGSGGASDAEWIQIRLFDPLFYNTGTN